MSSSSRVLGSALRESSAMTGMGQSSAFADRPGSGRVAQGSCHSGGHEFRRRKVSLPN
jgi:hypothetical protein